MASDQHGARESKEASQWFARLNQTAIRTEDLLAFRKWRAQPANAAAYDAVEQLWKQSGGLSHDPAIRAALDDARRRTGAARAGSGHLRLVAVSGLCGAALVAMVAAGLTLISPVLGWTIYQTSHGEQRTIALADGSHIRLDTSSRVRVRYGGGKREVELANGQAFFEVMHRPDEPFIVRVGRTTIRDLGTRFDVRRRDGGADVTLIQGSIEVTGPAKADHPWRLTAGQQIHIDKREAKAPKPANVEATTSWMSGRLVFENIPLSDAVAEINRYGVHSVTVEAADVNAIKVSGVFDAGDSAGFAQAVSQLYGLREHQQADGSIALSRTTLDRPS